jgi:hypothetical protein
MGSLMATSTDFASCLGKEYHIMLPTSAEGDRVSNNVTIGNAFGTYAISASFIIDTVGNGNDTLIVSGGTDYQ